MLSAITDELNSYLRRTVSVVEDKATLSALVDQEGNMAAEGENKVVGLLTAIEQERASLSQAPSRGGLRNPPVQLNLHVLFAAYFPGDYREALKFISLTLAFFQSKQVFTARNTPGLPAGAEKVVVEINNLDQQAQYQLWNAIGAKMIPSVSMKIRLIAITNDQILGEVPEITSTETTTPNQ